MNNEVWKQINDYPNYFVSNTGKVRNVKTGRELRQCLNQSGYLSVCLYSERKQRVTIVHRLVAQAFIDNPNNYDTVDHINGIKTDNRIENLQWLSRSDNSKRFHREQQTEEQLKQRKETAREMGKKSVNKAREFAWKSTRKPIICTNTGIIYESGRLASRKLGINSGNLSSVLLGKRKTVNGLHFEYL